MGWGLTIPQIGLPLLEHRALLEALPGWGYTDAWSAETSGTDAFVPLALASSWEPTLRLGTAIVPVYTRGPALIAMSAATMAAAAPGRFVLGLGASSPVIVGNWNGADFREPYRKSRDVLWIVKQALAGERVDGAFDTVTIKRFKLDNPPAPPPPVMLAALRPQMLRLAGREADGAILNWLASYDVPRCLDAIGAETETVARIFVCPTEDTDHARNVGRRLISSYLTVPAYAAFHDWLGRGEVLRPMHEAWAAGDRAGAAKAIPDEVVDDLVLHGSPESVRDQVQAYADAGLTTPVIALLPPPDVDAADIADIVRRMGRS
jgi:probable F420-dependent oxidoreductase